jgi:hypothetical protein
MKGYSATPPRARKSHPLRSFKKWKYPTQLCPGKSPSLKDVIKAQYIYEVTKKKTPYIRFIDKVTLSSPYLWASFHPLALFEWVSKHFLLNLNMKCWNSAFNTQRFESNYSSPTSRTSENICSSSGEF